MQEESEFLDFKSPLTDRAELDVNVILTFGTPNCFGERQEYFDLRISINQNEISASDFFENKFFKKIIKKCKRLNRDPKDLTKISTASNWNVFKEFTGKQSLIDLGHPCKWFFGNGRKDLDIWEDHLMKKYEFGCNQDMGWVNELHISHEISDPVLGNKGVGEKLSAVTLEDLGISMVVLASNKEINALMRECETTPDSIWCDGRGKLFLREILFLELHKKNQFFDDHPQFADDSNSEWVEFCNDCVLLAVLDAYLCNKPIKLIHPDSYEHGLKFASINATEGLVPGLIEDISVES